MDLLAIETFSWTSHLATAGDICIQQATAGRTVGFAFLNVDNPDDIIPPRVKYLGGNRLRRVTTMNRLLSKNGVRVLKCPKLPPSIRRDIASFERMIPSSIQELMSLSYKGASLGVGIASSLISHVYDSDPDLARHKGLLRRYLKAAASVYELSLTLFKENSPRAALIFNGRFACVKPIAEAAKAMGIPAQFHERGADYTRFELFDRPPHDIEYIRQEISNYWNKAPSDREERARSFFMRRRGGDTVGWISYTSSQEKGHVPPRTRNRRIVYFTSSDFEYAAISDVTTSSLFVDQLQFARRLIQWAGQQHDLELIIRIHPNVRATSSRERDRWERLSGDNIVLIPPHSAVDSYALLDSSDVVLAYNSTMGIEASYWGKPVIVLGDATYNGLGCVYEPKTFEDLWRLLGDQTLAPLPRERCLPFAYYMVTFGRRFQYYSPESLFSGRFLGEELSAEPAAVRMLKRSRAGKQLKRIFAGSLSKM